MNIAVIGSGAIGALVAGYLKLKGEDVYLVGRPQAVSAIKEHGLKITGVRGEFKIQIPIYDGLVSKPELVILAVKTQDIDGALKNNLALIKDSTVLTIQNGIQADYFAAKYISAENIISSIVMFGATLLESHEIVHNFEGSWVIGKRFQDNPDRKILDISLLLDKIFPVVISEDIRGMKYLKIFVNANNCIPAILGKSMQEVFADLELSRISIGIWKEGVNIVCKAGIKLVSLPGFPLENITKLTCLPAEQAAGIFSGIMTKLSKDPLYGSILQSIKRGRLSEIDYINGEFLNLARENNLKAPLNERLVELVHIVESSKKFFSKEELLDEVEGLYE